MCAIRNVDKKVDSEESDLIVCVWSCRRRTRFWQGVVIRRVHVGWSRWHVKGGADCGAAGQKMFLEHVMIVAVNTVIVVVLCISFT